MDRSGKGEIGVVIVVIGHFPAYVALSAKRGLKHFQVDPVTWESWTTAMQWSANRAFMDAAILANAVFILATPPHEARPGSWYRRELDYLRSKGYQARLSGLDWELFL